MSRLRQSVVAFLAAGAVLASGGAMADEAGERRIRSALEPFFGGAVFEKEALTVASEGNGYRITFDIAPLMAAVTIPAGTVAISPYSVLASERPDGNWDVTGNEPIALDLRFERDGRRHAVVFKIEESPFSGIWSPALRAFVSVEGRTGAGEMEVIDATSRTVAEFGGGGFSSSSSGAVRDMTSIMKQSITDLKETITLELPLEDGVTTRDISVDMARVGSDATVHGLRYGPILDVWSFLVTNFDQEGEQVRLRQEELRSRLRAALPLWRTMNSYATIEKLSIQLEQGGATIDSASYGVRFDGVSESGDYMVDYAFEGLRVDVPALPDWAKPLIPTAMRLAVTANDIDLATPAAIAVDSFDLTREDRFPPEAAERIKATFEGTSFSFLIEPGFVSGEDYRVDFEGELVVRGREDVEFNAVVTASGIDALTQTIQSAGTQEAFQAAGMLSVAKGFGRQIPDGRTIWQIEAASDGSVSVNGMQIAPPKR